MNEDELKKIWQTDKAAPTIDFTALQKSLNAWHDKLRRKVRIEIRVQNATIALTFVPVFFYPKLIFFALAVATLGAWYIPELRKLYKTETIENDDVRQSLNRKILTMKRYFRRTRIALYVLSPPLVPIAFYGLNFFETDSIIGTIGLIRMIFLTAISEAGIIIGNEIYFAVAYKPSFNELKDLLRQLDSDGRQE